MKKAIVTLMSIMMMLIAVMGLAACGGKDDKPEKYDVAIKVANNFGKEWIFTPDIDELYYEFEYTGEEMTFGVDAYYVYDAPQAGDRWLNCAGASINYFSGSWGYKNLEGKNENVHSVLERGDYCYTIYTRQTSWNNRTIRLFITVK